MCCLNNVILNPYNNNNDNSPIFYYFVPQAVLGGHGTVDPAELATKSNRPMILIGG